MPPAVLSWLQGLLRERFHDDIVLQQAGTGSCRLSLAGSVRRIEIRSDFGTFRRNPPDLPCGHWTPPDQASAPGTEESLPAPGMAGRLHRLVEMDDQGCIMHYDVLGLAYWMLSRREEAGCDTLDPHQRFPAYASHAFRHGYLERPIVDEWFEVLRGIMLAVWPELPLREHRYEVRLSHDVDTPARYALIGALRLVRVMLADLIRDRERDRHAWIRAPWIWAGSRQRIDERDPFNTFDWIMDRSEEAGLRNAFYFICGHTDPQRDGHYQPEHPAIVELMQRVHARGHEVGLHPSYHTYLDPAAMRQEAHRLRQACERAGFQPTRLGARMHYLRWKTPDTLYCLEEAGMAYDTTLGYADMPGFRCGTCHEYQAFDPVREKAMRLRIVPLVVMESTVIRQLHPHTVPQAEAQLLRLAEACRRAGGRFTLLWHNTMLEHAHQRQLYENVLDSHKEPAQ